MEVRRLRPDELDLLRDVRLRALRDAPSAFGSSYEREAAFGPEDWAQRIATPVYVALEAGRALGMAGGFVDARGRAVVWGVWVDPAARGRRLADRLIGDVTAWARAAGFPELELTVTDEAAAAAAVYVRMGFAATGETRPLPDGRTETVLVLPL